MDTQYLLSLLRFSILNSIISLQRKGTSNLPSSSLSIQPPHYLRVHNSCDHYTRTCPKDIPLHTLGLPLVAHTLSGQADDLNECRFIIFITQNKKCSVTTELNSACDIYNKHNSSSSVLSSSVCLLYHPLLLPLGGQYW